MTSPPTKILFVDDDVELRKMTHEALTSAGYPADEAEDGLEAIEKLRASKYDLVILDVNMPGKSGLELLQYVRRNFPRIRVIMMTGLQERAVTAESLKLGANDFISKPFTIDHLLHSIQRVLVE
jgi:DNA-binding response OmpR family regulator